MKIIKIKNKNSNEKVNIVKIIGKEAVQVGIEKIAENLIEKISNKLLEWINNLINDLTEKILNQFDNLFEELGTQMIILQEKMKIDEEIIKKIEKIIDLLQQIQSFISDIIKTAIQISKNGQIDTEQINEIINKFSDILKKKEFNFMINKKNL